MLVGRWGTSVSGLFVKTTMGYLASCLHTASMQPLGKCVCLAFSIWWELGTVCGCFNALASECSGYNWRGPVSVSPVRNGCRLYT